LWHGPLAFSGLSMIRNNTVLVLGAGASQPYGFPLGGALVDQICGEILQPDSTLTSRLRQRGVSREHCHKFAKALRGARPYSIDAFLEMRPEFENVGKLSIADVLLRAENQRTLSAAPQSVDWYRYLLNNVLVLRSRDHYRAQAQRLTIITFNFDRSFERALFLSLRDAFGMTDEEARNRALEIEVHHIHGQLGEPSWLKPESDDATRFGHHAGNVGPAMVKAARSIKIVSEDVKSRAVLEHATGALGRARHVYFLGFGFDLRNLSKLQIPGSVNVNSPTIRGTIFGFLPGESATIPKRFEPPGIHIYPLDVITFLRSHAEALFE
jgi:SIR2-like domain